MAVDGRKVGESLILTGESPEDNICTPCALDDRRVSAVKFCVECNENVCERCVADHQRYGGMKGHQIMATIRTDEDQKRVTYPSQRCTEHGGKVIDVFCADHDFVGCATCIAIEHRSCVNVKFIPDMANKGLTDTLLDDLDCKFAELIRRIDTLKKAKQDCAQQLSKARQQVVHEIKQLRQRLTEKLDQMERETLEQADDFFENKHASIDKILTETEDARLKILKHVESLSSCRDNNIPTIFVESKRSKTVLRDNAEAVDSLEQSPCVVSANFQISKNIEDILHSETKLGCLYEKPELNSLISSREYNIRLPNDSSTCDVRDVCMTKSGNIVLTDRGNNTVKLFNSNFTLKESQVTAGQPIGICEIDNFRLAVSLIDVKAVQFLSQNPLTSEKLFTVGDKCRGLAFYNKLLYVGCGGFKGEGPGQIKVFDVLGSLRVAYYGSFICPWYLYFPENDTMYISDFLGTDITEINLLDSRSLNRAIACADKPSGFCQIGSTKQTCVSCNKSNKIILLREEREARELLSEKNGIFNPRSVAFDQSQNRLIVPKEGSDCISVFKYLD